MSANMAFTIEPYRRFAPFTDWFTRLNYFFKVNNVKEEDKMAYFVTLSGPSMFAQVAFEDLIAKLKSRLDKIEPDLVQRYEFSSRVQNPGETTEDFVLALKLQAEFCGFDNINEKNSRQRLLGEGKLSLANAEKIIATWEKAKANAGAVDEGSNGNTGFVAAIRNGSERAGIAYGKLNRTLKLAKRYQEEEAFRGTGSCRGPVKSRLGIRSYDEGHHSRGKRHYGTKTVHFRQDGGFQKRQRPDYSQMVCNFCGMKGHIKKKCFKLKNLERDAVNLVDSYRPGPFANRHINELMERMRSVDSEDEESDTGDLHCMLASSINKISNPCLIKVKVEGKDLEMEVD